MAARRSAVQEYQTNKKSSCLGSRIGVAPFGVVCAARAIVRSHAPHVRLLAAVFACTPSEAVPIDEVDFELLEEAVEITGKLKDPPAQKYLKTLNPVFRSQGRSPEPGK